jgi:hypothetical protein
VHNVKKIVDYLNLRQVGYNAALTNTIYNDLRKIRKNIILNKVVELINRIPIINLLYIKYKR